MSRPNTDPLYPDTVILGQNRMTAANTDRTGATGTLYTVVTGAANGTRVDRLQFKALEATVVGMWRVYLTDNAGANPRLFDEIPVTAVTLSAADTETASADTARSDGLPYCVLPSGHLLRCTTHIGEDTDVTAVGGNF